MAFDQGKIIAGEYEQPISEIEFELKSGNVQDLLILWKLCLSKEIFILVVQVKRSVVICWAQNNFLTDWLNKWRDFLKKNEKKVR